MIAIFLPFSNRGGWATAFISLAIFTLEGARVYRYGSTAVRIIRDRPSDRQACGAAYLAVDYGLDPAKGQIQTKAIVRDIVGVPPIACLLASVGLVGLEEPP